MSFWHRIRASFQQFMQGRNGADPLSLALTWAGLFFYLVDLFVPLGLFSLLGLACYVWALFRMFSRNVEKRRAENARYLQLTGALRTQLRQARVRFQKRKEFKYFRCPKCHSILRLPRGVGEVTVTCGKCKNAFEKKA